MSDKKAKEISDSLITRRKSDHLRIVAEQDVTFSEGTLFSDVKLIHNALPEINSSDVDLSTEFFGKRLKAPFLITSMTGGAKFASNMNRTLARAAGSEGIAFSVGSQRVMFNHPESAADFQVRDEIPDGVLLGNIGAVQLLEYSIEKIKELADKINADGMCVHLNPAQELVQLEGNRNFSGLTDKIAELAEKLNGNVLVKETGAGLSIQVLEKLKNAGVKYIDISGSGGTSWTKVEMHRDSNEELAYLGQTFAEWGIPSAVSLIAAGTIMPVDTKLVCSGGMVNGLQMAKAIACGADITGFARAILLEYLKSGEDGSKRLIGKFKEELKTAMILTGCKNIFELQHSKKVIVGQLREWLISLGIIRGEF